MRAKWDGGGHRDGAAQEGDTALDKRRPPEAQGELHDLYAGQFEHLLAMAQRALPADADVEDLVQTVFEEALRTRRARPRFEPGVGWLKRRLRSRIADHYRRHAREQRRQGLLGLEADRVALQPAADQAAVIRVYTEELLRTIPDPIDRAALALKLHQYRESEIAALLNLEQGTRQVRDRLARARKSVRDWREGIEQVSAAG
jgi:RNA polymerase sigma factor (sigma-70 family)